MLSISMDMLLLSKNKKLKKPQRPPQVPTPHQLQRQLNRLKLRQRAKTSLSQDQEATLGVVKKEILASVKEPSGLFQMMQPTQSTQQIWPLVDILQQTSMAKCLAAPQLQAIQLQVPQSSAFASLKDLRAPQKQRSAPLKEESANAKEMYTSVSQRTVSSRTFSESTVEATLMLSRRY